MCSMCVKNSCQGCVSNIADTDCQQCGKDILSENKESFYCDESVSMHQQACRLSCRSREASSYYRDGSCDQDSGLCVCSISFFLFTIF
jgi:hypothetical protein